MYASACVRSKRAARKGDALLDCMSNSIPCGHFWPFPMHPNTNRTSDDIFLRHETHLRKSAVQTVVAIVAHEVIVTGWHNRFEVGAETSSGEHDDMLLSAEVFATESRADVIR